ncbi:MAG TPA: chain length determinant protein EpsF [Burkholderiaceae bacterium]|nr:chain length determinant protein EpsF [Burkholderiaceae bacterium]
MNIDQMIRALWARKWSALLVVAVVTGLTVAVSLLLPKQYKATASVVIDVKTPDPVMGVLLPVYAVESYMATQVDIVQSVRVARRVVDAMGMDQAAAVQDNWRRDTEGRGDLKTWIAERLLKRLDVKPARQSNVIDVSFTGADPDFAAAVANAFAAAYIRTVVELRAEPAQQNAAFFDTRTRAAREEMEAAQKKLYDYQRANNIVSMEERLDVENQRLAELTSQYTLVQAQLMDSRSRESAASQRGGETLQEMQQSQLIQGLKVDLARAESRLQEIRARLGTAHPQHASAQAEVSSLRARLDAEMGKVRGGIDTTREINARREAQLKAAVEAQRAKVLKLKAQRDQVGSLQAEVLQSQKQYDVLSQRLTQTSLESENRQTNVAVLTAATPPVKPSQPKMLLNTALAVALGLLLGGATALLRELKDRRARAAGDLTAALRAPLLVTLPASHARAARRFVPRRAGAMQDGRPISSLLDRRAPHV